MRRAARDDDFRGRRVPPPRDDLDRLVRLVQRHLSDDLRRAPWSGSRNRLAGHCFVASEAIYYLLGGRAAGWKPLSVRHEGAPHWLLLHEPSGRRLDATEWQFRARPDASCAVGKGFMSSRADTPSKRAQELMRRVREDPEGDGAIVAAFAVIASRPVPTRERPNPPQSAISPEERRRFDLITMMVRRCVEAGEEAGSDCFRMAGDELPLISHGGARYVFALDEGRVLKVAVDGDDWGDEGQNANEIVLWSESDARTRQLLAPIIGYAADASWLVMARTQKVRSVPTEARRRLLAISEDVEAPNVGTIDGRYVLHDYGLPAESHGF